MAWTGLSFSTKNKWKKNYFKGIVEKRKGWKTGDPGSSPGSDLQSGFQPPTSPLSKKGDKISQLGAGRNVN